MKKNVCRRHDFGPGEVQKSPLTDHNVVSTGLVCGFDDYTMEWSAISSLQLQGSC